MGEAGLALCKNNGSAVGSARWHTSRSQAVRLTPSSRVQHRTCIRSPRQHAPTCRHCLSTRERLHAAVCHAPAAISRCSWPGSQARQPAKKRKSVCCRPPVMTSATAASWAPRKMPGVTCT